MKTQKYELLARIYSCFSNVANNQEVFLEEQVPNSEIDFTSNEIYGKLEDKTDKQKIQKLEKISNFMKLNDFIKKNYKICKFLDLMFQSEKQNKGEDLRNIICIFTSYLWIEYQRGFKEYDEIIKELDQNLKNIEFYENKQLNIKQVALINIIQQLFEISIIEVFENNKCDIDLQEFQKAYCIKDYQNIVQGKTINENTLFYKLTTDEQIQNFDIVILQKIKQQNMQQNQIKQFQTVEKQEQQNWDDEWENDQNQDQQQKDFNKEFINNGDDDGWGDWQ